MDSFYWRGAEGPCLASYLSNGNVQVHSLPSLRPLLTADLVPLAELNFQSNKPANLVDPMVNIWAHQIFASEDAGRYAPKPPDVVHILFESHPLGIDVYQSAKHQRLTQFSGLVHRSLLLLGLHSLPLPLGTTSTNVFFYSFRFFFFVFFLTGSVAISDSATTATACICARRPKSESSPFLRRLRTFSPLICRSLGFFFKMTSFRWTSKFHPTGLALKKKLLRIDVDFFFLVCAPTQIQPERTDGRTVPTLRDARTAQGRPRRFAHPRPLRRRRPRPRPRRTMSVLRLFSTVIVLRSKKYASLIQPKPDRAIAT